MCHLHVPIYTKVHGKMWPSDTNSLCKSISVETFDLRSPVQAIRHATRTLVFQVRHEEFLQHVYTSHRCSKLAPKNIKKAGRFVRPERKTWGLCFHQCTRIFLLTYLLTPCSRVLFEKLTGSQLLKKFPAFYATPRFITTFTSARHLSVSRTRSIQSIPSHALFWKSILILSSHLRLVFQAVSFPQVSLPNPLYTSTIPHTCYHAPSTSFFSIWSPEHYWVRSTYFYSPKF
jgi:hypothetical protein